MKKEVLSLAIQNIVDMEKFVEDDKFEDAFFYNLVTPSGELFSGVTLDTLFDILSEEVELSKWNFEPRTGYSAITRGELKAIREMGAEISEDIFTKRVAEEISDSIKEEKIRREIVKDDIKAALRDLPDDIKSLVAQAESIGENLEDLLDEVVSEEIELFLSLMMSDDGSMTAVSVGEDGIKLSSSDVRQNADRNSEKMSFREFLENL